MIDRTGKWWIGTEAADVEEYLRGYTEGGYPADHFEAARCACSAAVFRLDADRDEGCARRTCTSCESEHFICDSANYSEAAHLEPIECPCGNNAFDLAAAFSHGSDGSVRWISVGVRCAACGVLGCPVEWKIDYAPTEHLYQQV